MTDDSFGFAPPPFKPDDALAQVKRALRDLTLSERGNGFELRGKRVVEFGIDGATLTARMARKLALTPQWDSQTIKTTADQHKLLDELKRRLARWHREE